MILMARKMLFFFRLIFVLINKNGFFFLSYRLIEDEKISSLECKFCIS